MDLERIRAKGTVAKLIRKLPVIEKLKAIPGIKSVCAPTLVAWIAAQRPAFGWTPGDSRVEALERPTPGSGSARGLQTGNRRGVRGRRSARRSGPSAERAVRVATGNSALRPAFGQAYPLHRRRGRDQGGQRFRAPLPGTYRGGLGAPQGDSRRGSQNTFHGVRDYENRKGVRPGTARTLGGIWPSCDSRASVPKYPGDDRRLRD